MWICFIPMNSTGFSMLSNPYKSTQHILKMLYRILIIVDNTNIKSSMYEINISLIKIHIQQLCIFMISTWYQYWHMNSKTKLYFHIWNIHFDWIEVKVAIISWVNWFFMKSIIIFIHSLNQNQWTTTIFF